ncbi:MAG: hypothetical protein PHU31_11660 [Anaerotignum sp.]|nr:hypothetical protein [Anaerotignum sp.]
MIRSKKFVILGVLFILLISYFCFTSTAIQPTLKGFYQSEMISEVGNAEAMIIQISIFEDGKFKEYITNRLVNQGTVRKMNDFLYHFDGDEADFDIILKNDNSFQIEMSRLNNGNPIELENVNRNPCTFGAQWDDVEEYKTYLK